MLRNIDKLIMPDLGYDRARRSCISIYTNIVKRTQGLVGQGYYSIQGQQPSALAGFSMFSPGRAAVLYPIGQKNPLECGTGRLE